MAILDLTTFSETAMPEHASLFATGSLDAFLAAGHQVWADVRTRLLAVIEDEAAYARHLVARQDATLLLPFTVADYVDFYASEHHATNIGKIFRPDGDALTPNWKHLPIGYHGRAGTVVVSGTPVRRPRGQRRTSEGEVTVGPTAKLDIEAELGFVVGAGSTLGEPVAIADFSHHVFGVCLVNDWSARDLQAWEYVPLGPFLGKSFATSVAPWIVPLAAMEQARVPAPPRTVELQGYLDDRREDWGLDVSFEIRLNSELLSRPPFASMYWTGAQMLAHMTVNGASLRPGDLYASGTVSGPTADQRGSLIELTWNGTEPLTLADGSVRTFLEDGDSVSITAYAPGPNGARLWLGAVEGTIC